MPPKQIHDPIERAMWKAYNQQRWRARQSGIPFLFTFEQWVAWWMTDGRWALRGRSKNKLVMARVADKGGYFPGNVYCTTLRGNLLDVPHEKRRIATQRGWDDHPERVSHFAVRGANHPRSRPVKTPRGIFGSATLAAEAFEITRHHAALMARRGLKGWRYI